MKNFSLYLAIRYLRGAYHEQTIATMVLVSFLSIIISTMCLTLVVIITRGFEKETFKTIQGCHAPLCIQSYGNHLAFESIEKVLKNEFPDVHYSPSDMHYIMPEDSQGGISHVVILKGVDPILEASTTTIEKKILPYHSKTITMQEALRSKSVLIGYQLARMLNLHVGQSMSFYYAPEAQEKKNALNLTKELVTVRGIFKTGIEEFDAHLVLCSLTTFQSIFQESGITTISINPQSQSNIKKLQEQLVERFGLETTSWKDRYPALVAALTLETYASFIILCIIVLVASMSILSLLFMQITQKRGDIALLTTLGASTWTIKKIFIIMGLLIAFFGALIGLILAYIIAFILHSYVRIDLPDAYYVTQLPIALEPLIFVLAFIVVMVISFCAIWFATRSIDNIKIADVLRFEA
jgi:lipoprotein-releasing system permease protein